MCASSSSGGKPSRVGAASTSTRCHRPSSVSRQRAIDRAAARSAGVIVLACLSRSLTSPPIWSGRGGEQVLVGLPGLGVEHGRAMPR